MSRPAEQWPHLVMEQLTGSNNHHRSIHHWFSQSPQCFYCRLRLAPHSLASRHQRHWAAGTASPQQPRRHGSRRRRDSLMTPPAASRRTGPSWSFDMHKHEDGVRRPMTLQTIGTVYCACNDER